jgi:hypothetical protein
MVMYLWYLEKLQKLDILDSISERLRNIEGKFDIVEKDISQLKQSVNIHDQRLNTNDQDMRGFHHRISELECFFWDVLEDQVVFHRSSLLWKEGLVQFASENWQFVSCSARFVYFKDKETVLKAARTSLRDKPQKIYSQFPQEIGNRRRELVTDLPLFDVVILLSSRNLWSVT